MVIVNVTENHIIVYLILDLVSIDNATIVHATIIIITIDVCYIPTIIDKKVDHKK
jgi:hypothetical protein